MDHLSKFNINWMVNKPRNNVLQKLRRLEKSVTPGDIKLASGGSYYVKSTKSNVFAQCSRCLAESPLLPGGSSQKPRKQHIIHASSGGPSMPPDGFWKNSKNVKTEKVLIIPRHHKHTLYYANIIKQFILNNRCSNL